jgi:acyl dehydratase
MTGHWLEDFMEKPTFHSAGRTVAESDLVQFAGLTGDFSPVHTDEEYCKSTDFGTRIGHGLLGLAIAQGLMWRTGYTLGTGIASVAWSQWDFLAPFHIGDTVHVEWTIAEARESRSRPTAGVVTEDIRLLDQRGTVLQRGQHVMLVRRRPGESA